MKPHCTEYKQARVNSVGDRKMPLLIILFSLLITGCGSSSFAQSSSAKTAVLIIGTVHSGNRHITPKTLGKVLSNFSPDIVLIEQDEDFKPVFGLFAAYWLRIARPSMEQLAEQRFHRKNKHIPILAYDTIIPARKEYVRKLTRIIDSFHDSLHHANMDEADSLRYADYVSRHNRFYDLYINGTLAMINTDTVYKIEADLRAREQLLILLANKYVSDKQLIEDYQAEVLFWTARNDYMVKKILSVAAANEGKRLAVITGLAHKYYLRDRLAQSSRLIFQELE
jgi:hypothetical protein